MDLTFVAETPSLLEVLQRPYPAAQKKPIWFERSERFYNGEPDVNRYNQNNTTLKNDTKVSDFIEAGYHIPLPSDVWLENGGDKNLLFKWAFQDIDVVTVHDQKEKSEYVTPPNYYSTMFKWVNPWIVKTPPGWSSLFIHPAYQEEESEFKSLPCIVDTDVYPKPVNIPFHLRKGFGGLIQMGTPFVQVIPFKRDNFKAHFEHDQNGYFKKLWDRVKGSYFSKYETFFRQKKQYL